MHVYVDCEFTNFYTDCQLLSVPSSFILNGRFRTGRMMFRGEKPIARLVSMSARCAMCSMMSCGSCFQISSIF